MLFLASYFILILISVLVAVGGSRGSRLGLCGVRIVGCGRSHLRLDFGAFEGLPYLLNRYLGKSVFCADLIAPLKSF